MSDQNDQISITLRANIDGFQRAAMSAANELNKIRSATRDVAEENKRASASADAYILSLNRQAVMLGRTAAEQRILEVGTQRLTAEQRTHALGVVNSINAYEAHQASMARMSSQMMVVGTAIAAAGTAMYFMTKAGIDAADQLHDMNQKTGIAVETLAGYKLVAEQSGTSLEGVAHGVKNLSKFMVGHEAELRAAGVTARDADGAMRQLADIFKAMPDGIEQTNLAMKVFGKSGQDMIPVLNLGGDELGRLIERGKELNPITAEMAKQADQFNDQMTELNMSITAVGISMAKDMLPALNELIGRMAEGMRASGGFAGGIKEIAAAGMSEQGLKTRIQNIDSGDNPYETDTEDRARYERELNRRREDRAAEVVAGYGNIDSREGKAYSDRAAMDATGKANTLTAGKGKKAKAAKIDQNEVGPMIPQKEWLDRLKAEDFMGPIISDVELKWRESHERQIAAEEAKNQRITDAALVSQGERYSRLTATEETDRSMKDEQLQADLGLLAANRELWLMDEAAYEERRSQLVIEAANKRSTTLENIAVRLKNFEELTAINKTKTLMDLGSALTAGFATQSKTAFELNKKVSIGRAVINTFEAATSAYKAMAGIPYVGPIVGAIAAAGAIAFGMAQVSQIKSQSFDGGGGGAGAGSIPSMPTYTSARANSDLLEGGPTPIPVAETRGKAAAPERIITFDFTNAGPLFTKKMMVDEMLPLMEEAINDGAGNVRFEVANG